METCIPCKQTEKLLRENEELASLVRQHFIFKKILADTDRYDSLKQLYGVKHLPYFMFMDSKGTLLNAFYPTSRVDVLRWQLNQVVSGQNLPILENRYAVDSSLSNWAAYLTAKLDAAWYEEEEIEALLGRLTPIDMENPRVNYFLFRVLYPPSNQQGVLKFTDEVTQYFFKHYTELNDRFPEMQLASKLESMWADQAYASLDSGKFEAFLQLMQVEFPWRLDTLEDYAIHTPAQFPKYGRSGVLERKTLWVNYFIRQGDTLSADSMLNLMENHLEVNPQFDEPNFLADFSRWYAGASYSKKWGYRRMERQYENDPFNLEYAEAIFKVHLYFKDLKKANKVYRKIKPVAKTTLEGESLLNWMKRKLKKAKKQ